MSHSESNKILITGAAGFIGSHLTEKLAEEGYDVIAVDNFNDFYDPQIKEENIEQVKEKDNCHLVRGDIVNEELFEKHDIEKIIHLAALAGVRASLASPQDFVETDIKGTVNLLEAARKNDVEQFVFASSSSVYGESDDVPFEENQNTEDQVSPYACAKKSAELYCRTYHNLYEIPTTVLRFFTVYGPRQRPEMAIHKFTRLVFKGEEIPMYGDGSSIRDYTYITDITQGITSALEKKFDFEVFNLGNSETVKLKKLIGLIEEKTGKEAKINQLPSQPGDVSKTYADISKSKAKLGYEPQVSIEEGLEKFIQWYKNNKL